MDTTNTNPRGPANHARNWHSNLPFLRECEAKIPAANKPRLQKAVERLIRFYKETAWPDKAAEWKQKLGELAKPTPNAQLGVEAEEK